MLSSNRLPAGLCALQAVTVLGLLANPALPSVRRAPDPRQTIVLSALPALIHSTDLVCKRTAVVFARVHLLLRTTTSTSVTAVGQSALLAKFRISTLRRQSTRLSALVACLVMFFIREPAYKVAPRVPFYLPRITLLVPRFLRQFVSVEHVQLVRDLCHLSPRLRNVLQGGSFSQCTSCNKNLPVLTNGRCLATCSQNQYFDPTSSTCQSCDGSCASCSGSGPNNCLACSSSSQVLRGGTCVTGNCSSGTNVVSGLGACLAELVASPSSSGSSPLPSISGISTPTSTMTQALSWWEILLMALGCAFIFVAFLYFWRRRARKQRAKETAAFASAKALNRKSNWRLRLMHFGERLFGHSPPQHPPNSEEIALWKLRAAEEARHNQEVEKLIETYGFSGAGSPREARRFESHDHESYRSHRLSGGSLYAEVTGIPQRGPEPRQPVKTNPLTSRFSSTTLGSSVYKKPSLTRREPFPPKSQTDAEAYATSFYELLPHMDARHN
ncbi:hypothetical protein J3R83DRAFT_1589 [Lanmaoa asiatica]|nr:hypothetical protein J3R83DRAFT_1589 [Lanmaoa asiatica]